MKISSPSRKTKARKPSHFGSKIQSPSVGNSSTRLASIGNSGGVTGRGRFLSYNGHYGLIMVKLGQNLAPGFFSPRSGHQFSFIVFRTQLDGIFQRPKSVAMTVWYGPCANTFHVSCSLS